MAAIALAAFAQARAEVLDLAEVALAHLAGAGGELRDRFEPVELDVALEGEFQLVGVHRVEDDDLVAAEAQVLDAVEYGLLVVEQIADEDDDPLAADLAGDVVEHAADARRL